MDGGGHGGGDFGGHHGGGFGGHHHGGHHHGSHHHGGENNSWIDGSSGHLHSGRGRGQGLAGRQGWLGVAVILVLLLVIPLLAR